MGITGFQFFSFKLICDSLETQWNLEGNARSVKILLNTRA